MADPTDRLRRVARVAQALSHPSRLQIVEALEDGERCVCMIQPLIGLDMSTVSKHLAVLREAGLVEDERRGAMVFYRLCSPGVALSLVGLERVANDQTARLVRAVS